MQIGAYLEEVRSRYATGQATELSYRTAIEGLFRSIDNTIEVINEPRRIAVGAPDFVFNRGVISIGWAEAKDLGKDIRRLKDYSREQKERYKKALPNLIYTNGIDFEFIRESRPVNYVSIADFLPSLPPRPDKFDELARSLRAFAQQRPVSIRTSGQLASYLAGKAAMIKDVIHQLLITSPNKGALAGQYKAFKADLIAHLEVDEFADIYAETITYGMFAARLHDKSLDTFSRQEALGLLPRTNPFLKSLFSYIAGPELDDRLSWIIDDLADILRASNPRQLFEEYGKYSHRNDPFMHFYEDFLREYNPKKRKARGVWYTPEPVVDFIVRSVDLVLKLEFGLKDGLADTGRIAIKQDTGTKDNKGRPVLTKVETHRVQILDPATGTGTFLANAVHLISNRVKSRAPGKWSSYVEKELTPRIHGFELLMASYTMCHMKLDMVLEKTGYKASPDAPRLSIWLTDSLEEGERDIRDLFFTALAEEARGANEVKRNKPIMCIMGNPPYSGESDNKGEWITRLMTDYKREPGTKNTLDERNTKWINKDEHKFIRMSTEYICRNGSGVLGFITSHGYISDPTLRGMRWHLLNSFDKIYILDLNGNANRNDLPVGFVDANVFDIKQGVAIIIAIRKVSETKRGLAKVFYKSKFGSRDEKQDMLFSHTASFAENEIAVEGPMWRLMPPHDKKLEDEYGQGFALNKLFMTFGNGIVTKRDRLCVQDTAEKVWESLEDFIKKPEHIVRSKYAIPDDVRDWKYDWAKKDVVSNFRRQNIKKILYRPFEPKYLFYTGHSRGFVGWPVPQVMSHYLDKENVGLLSSKAHRDAVFAHAFVTNCPTEAIALSAATGSNAMNFPLYLYHEKGKKNVNFHPSVARLICKAVGLPEIKEASSCDLDTVTGVSRPPELMIFDYIYGVLHSSTYRERYANLLKSGFPRIPYPRTRESFFSLASAGEKLRRLHLGKDECLADGEFVYMGDGDDNVASGFPVLKEGSIYINETQYFVNVPNVCWDALVGSYFPARKWLKDRRGKILSWDEVVAYQKLLAVLQESERTTRTIDLIPASSTAS